MPRCTALTGIPIALAIAIGCTTTTTGRTAPPFRSAVWVIGSAAAAPRLAADGWHVRWFFDANDPDAPRDVSALHDLIDGTDRAIEVIGVTGATRDAALDFAERSRVRYPILAHAQSDLAAFGVDRLPAVYLIDPGDKIVAEGFEAIGETLAGHDERAP